VPKTLDHEIETLAAEQHGLIAHAQAVGLGATKEAIRHRRESGRWLVHRPSVYRLPGTPGGPRVDLHAAVLAAGGNAVASHLSAAALHGIPGFPEDRLEVSVTAARSPDVFGALVHRKALLPPAHVTRVDNIPTTTAARALFDLAGTIHPLRAERALDNCLAWATVTLPEVQQVFDDLAKRGRTGTALMRELLLARGPGYVAPASGLEGRFLRLLHDAGMPLPERELDVGDAATWVGRVEFVYRQARVLVEIDSRRHHSSLLDLEADKARDNQLMAAGWRVLRVSDLMLRERPEGVVSLVGTALAAAAS
jgi:hypothetical protein